MKTHSARQETFEAMVLGTLLYSVVIGFFNDYTDVLATTSYSITFALAFVMQALTYLTLLLKNWVMARLREQERARYKIALGFCIWLILFLSKFVFLAVIDWLLGESVNIDGFIGIMLIIITMTVARLVVENIYRALGERREPG